MNTTPDDAYLIFDGWKEKGSHLRIQLRSSSLMFEGRGVILYLSHDKMELGGESWRFTVPLSDSTFVFSDPREIPIASVREAETARYEFGLAVQLSTGDRLVLVEYKEIGQKAEDTPEDDA
jgi:hypothetical protein